MAARQRFFLLPEDNESRRRKLEDITTWDPWPVKMSTKRDSLFDGAKEIVRKRNNESIDRFIDSVVILPASGNLPGYQGGSESMPLYSIRSPGALPTRIHLWQTREGKIMARHGLLSLPLTGLLRSFGARHVNTIQCVSWWKALDITDAALAKIDLPRCHHEELYRRWLVVNGFRFMDLPLELREHVVTSLMDRRIKWCSPRKGNFNRGWSIWPLAKANCQLYCEVMSFFYRKAVWCFTSLEQFRKMSKTVFPGFWVGIRSVELRLVYQDLVDLFAMSRLWTSDPQAFTGLTTRGMSLQRVKIMIPKTKNKCKKLRNERIWASIRVALRNVRFVEFAGDISQDEKRNWLETLAIENLGILPDPEDFAAWKHRILQQG